MVYITRRTPTERRTDKPLGKIIGHMQAFIYWLQREGDCTTIDIVIPDEWYCKWVQDFLIDWMKRVYATNYQKTYNQGADQGNKLHNQVFGAIDDVLADAKGKIAEVETRLNSLINDAKSRITTLDTNLSAFESRLRSSVARLEAFNKDIDIAFSELKKHKDNIRDLYYRVTTLEKEKSPLESLLKMR